MSYGKRVVYCVRYLKNLARSNSTSILAPSPKTILSILSSAQRLFLKLTILSGLDLIVLMFTLSEFDCGLGVSYSSKRF